jgi:thymidylate synthase (FAD)
MKVDVLQKTKHPERLVCQAARGDYYGGYVGDVEYAELMASIDGDDLEAKTRNFIEKQLSRGHYGPFEHPQITFAVESISRVTMAQITRHRHLTFDVQSQRYVDFSDTEAVVPKSLQDGEQNVTKSGEDSSNADTEMWQGVYQERTSDLFDLYEQMVDGGVPKEDARYVLPLATPVNMTVSGNARTFLHLLNLRKKADAQSEIRELSELLLDELFSWMPFTFEWYDANAPMRLSP